MATFLVLHGIWNYYFKRFYFFQNVRPLIDVIKFSENIEKAMKFIFGKILICKDLEIAVHVARLYRFTCVTLDGDKVVHFL